MGKSNEKLRNKMLRFDCYKNLRHFMRIDGAKRNIKTGHETIKVSVKNFLSRQLASLTMGTTGCCISMNHSNLQFPLLRSYKTEECSFHY